ncbi:exported hypothetical protein [Bradyrhizobium sp. ORS 375]|uniref:hypothetical protein n=1 Tax=Bradyrhizobium sp. (strain ORS 375) TaxID=566679 RepID=UPI00024059D0|nr:hypothetical protein [Bradyrhizobium sp. ORS 375]CCD96599.1 exported hypothetical protein [Bradyrhizobium sp. ORS 375]
MRQLQLSVGVLASIGIVLSSMSSGVHAEDRANQGPQATAALVARLPAEYRRQIADYVRARNTYVLRDAQISAPYERWGGLFAGGTFIAVCVKLHRDNMLGMVVQDNHVLTFDGGKLHEVRLGTEACDNLSRFTELMSPPAASQSQRSGSTAATPRAQKQGGARP